MKTIYDLRKELHKNPEKGFEEFETKKIILNYLEKFENQIEITEVLETGLIIKYTGDPSREDFIFYRADMDALPITEKTNAQFKSQKNGWMHACGHDVHMTVLMGILESVITSNEKINILFFYQPAEEGPGGADPFIKTGFLKEYNIKACLGLHVSGFYNVGEISTRPGPFFASPTEFDVLFNGISSHGAMPHLGKDAIIAAANYLNITYERIFREIPNYEEFAFTIGALRGGTRRNIIAEEAILEGSYRVFDNETDKKIRDIIESNSKNIACLFGLKSSVTYGASYPVLLNDASLYGEFKKTVEQINIKFIEAEKNYTGEDFAFFSQIYPSIFFWLGCGTEKMRRPLHDGLFLPDEGCIDVGVKACLSFMKKIW